MWREAWRATYRPTLGEAAVEAMLRSLERDGIASLLPPGTSAGFCALDGETIVATAIHSVDRPIVHLWGFHVLPVCQRSGLGLRLMAKVRETAGRAPIECHVLEARTPALRFYRAEGFEITGREDVEITSGVEATCLVMRDRR